jgi:glycosyltransferase involved in cell wall biosynthesis
MKELILNEASFYLDIVGEGPLRPQLESLSQNLGLSEFITFHGRVNNPRELLERADIFILSSIYEGFGLVLLEAMDCALPIIAARNSAIPEVIGNSGLMYETHSQQDLIEKVLFLKDLESRNKFAALSVDRVADFSSKIMYEKMALIYQGIYQSEKKVR